MSRLIKDSCFTFCSSVRWTYIMLNGNIISILFISAYMLSACSAKETQIPKESNVTPALQTREIRNEKGVIEKIESYYIDPTGKDVLHGPQIEMDNGYKYREIYYANGKKDGAFTEWEGLFHTKRREGHFRLGEQIGTWLTWNSPDDLLAVEIYEKGRPAGSWITWHSNGRKASECLYRNGCKDGKEVFWTENGDVYREDLHNGKGFLLEINVWHKNGKKMMHGTYLDQKDFLSAVEKAPQHEGKTDLEDGCWTYWDEEGNIVVDGVWKEGMPWDGVCGKVSGGSLASIYRVRSLKLARYKNGKMIEEIKLPSAEDLNPTKNTRQKG